MPGCRVRGAQACDLERMASLYLALQEHLEASNADLWRMTAAARGQMMGQLAPRLTAPGSCALVAEQGGAEIVGLALGRVLTNTRYEPLHSGFIDQLFVVPDYRRRGIGARLVRELCTFFVAQGVSDVSLRTVPGNEEATAFWAALGFTPRIVTLGLRLRQA